MAAPHLAADLSGDKQKEIFVDHMCHTFLKAYSGKKHDIQENYEVCLFSVFWGILFIVCYVLSLLLLYHQITLIRTVLAQFGIVTLESPGSQ